MRGLFSGVFKILNQNISIKEVSIVGKFVKKRYIKKLKDSLEIYFLPKTIRVGFKFVQICISY